MRGTTVPSARASTLASVRQEELYAQLPNLGCCGTLDGTGNDGGRREFRIGRTAPHTLAGSAPRWLPKATQTSSVPGSSSVEFALLLGLRNAAALRVR